MKNPFSCCATEDATIPQNNIVVLPDKTIQYKVTTPASYNDYPLAYVISNHLLTIKDNLSNLEYLEQSELLAADSDQLKLQVAIKYVLVGAYFASTTIKNGIGIVRSGKTVLMGTISEEMIISREFMKMSDDNYDNDNIIKIEPHSLLRAGIRIIIENNSFNSEFNPTKASDFYSLASTHEQMMEKAEEIAKKISEKLALSSESLQNILSKLMIDIDLHSNNPFIQEWTEHSNEYLSFFNYDTSRSMAAEIFTKKMISFLDNHLKMHFAPPAADALNIGLLLAKILVLDTLYCAAPIVGGNVILDKSDIIINSLQDKPSIENIEESKTEDLAINLNIDSSKNSATKIQITSSNSTLPMDSNIKETTPHDQLSNLVFFNFKPDEDTTSAGIKIINSDSKKTSTILSEVEVIENTDVKEYLLSLETNQRKAENILFIEKTIKNPNKINFEIETYQDNSWFDTKNLAFTGCNLLNSAFNSKNSVTGLVLCSSLLIESRDNQNLSFGGEHSNANDFAN